MITNEQYGNVTLSIVDKDGSEGLREYVNFFGRILELIDEDHVVSIYAKASEDTYEIALLANNSIVRPESVGLDEFVDLFERGNHPVAGWIDLNTLNRIRERLKEYAENH